MMRRGVEASMFEQSRGSCAISNKCRQLIGFQRGSRRNICFSSIGFCPVPQLPIMVITAIVWFGFLVSFVIYKRLIITPRVIGRSGTPIISGVVGLIRLLLIIWLVPGVTIQLGVRLLIGL
ncbi:hypothetical protein BJX61DRAFT_363010 [Aspergillus egyptiacus]|nr:hypothetical protein BJX61DRAFT_363010 [Aspergillus egyptiacus]